jgi:hypothetical protein
MNMEDTSGFYKLDSSLLYGHDLVLNTNYELHRIQHLNNPTAAYAYPVDGWHWFDSEAEAREHFGLPPLADPVE